MANILEVLSRIYTSVYTSYSYRRALAKYSFFTDVQNFPEVKEWAEAVEKTYPVMDKKSNKNTL